MPLALSLLGNLAVLGLLLLRRNLRLLDLSGFLFGDIPAGVAEVLAPLVLPGLPEGIRIEALSVLAFGNLFGSLLGLFGVVFLLLGALGPLLLPELIKPPAVVLINLFDLGLGLLSKEVAHGAAFLLVLLFKHLTLLLTADHGVESFGDNAPAQELVRIAVAGEISRLLPRARLLELKEPGFLTLCSE